MIRIAIDVMSGDPGKKTGLPAAVKGAIQALKWLKVSKLQIILIGRGPQIVSLLRKNYKQDYLWHLKRGRLKIVHASQVVGMNSKYDEAVVKFPDSSIARGIQLIRQNKADVFLSPGNTGIVVVYAVKEIGMVRGLARPPICSLIPTQDGSCIMLDVGANIDCKPRHLLKFAFIGMAYARIVLGIKFPRVCLLNMGSEPEKGPKVLSGSKDDIGAYKLLQKNLPDEFIGNIEGNEILKGKADVIVCDGFIGNVALKVAEGLYSGVKSLYSKMPKRQRVIGILGSIQLLIPFIFLVIFHPSFLMLAFVPSWCCAFFALRYVWKYFKQRLDYREYGGALLAGIKRPVIIAHGRSKWKAILSAIRQAVLIAQKDINPEIERLFNQ